MEEQTLYSLWQMLISRKSTGTALSYQEALRRFQKDNGYAISWSEFTPGFIDLWVTRMRNDHLSKTTINIYLRSLSAVLHVAYDMHYLSVMPKFLFRGLGIFSHNSSNSRKHCYLPASEWRKLWVYFECEGKGYKGIECWSSSKRKSSLVATGLMLFMYLGNGMNLCDMCRLRYGKFYFQTGGKQLQFCRHKTETRTGATVELPILYELQIIMDRLGQRPQEDSLVFPFLKTTIGDPLREHKAIANLGHFIRDQMQDLVDILQLPCCPTPTWARHSFATNLIQAGVPKDYVSWAMAHVNTDVTSRYVAAYSYEQMLNYNSRLFHHQGIPEYLVMQAKALSKAERQRLLQLLSEV